MTTLAFDVFRSCCDAVERRVNIDRASQRDKEFHFQDWVQRRIEELGVTVHRGARNAYPDFAIAGSSDGYEVKGLEFPGRYLNFDANSQIPVGRHGSFSAIFYVFGRYPKSAGPEYPVTDLVVCHGDFLNADHEYVHKNRHVTGFGSYGDIMIRDRKMYVVPTPYALSTNMDGQLTLIVPEEYEPPPDLLRVGTLVRREATNLVIGYRFDLRSNVIEQQHAANPTAGREHTFAAYRPRVAPGEAVELRASKAVLAEEELELELELVDSDE